MQKKKGISLIVLVITIIVMIILAGTIILSLNNAGIIGKASEAVEKTNIKQVQALAELKWSEAYLDNNKETYQLKEAVKTKLEQELGAEELAKYNVKVTSKGVTVELVEDTSIPENATEKEGANKEFMYVVLANGDIQITRYIGNMTEVVIPATYDGYDVYAIGNIEVNLNATGKQYNMFGVTNSNANATITNVEISEGIKEIKPCAFWGCSALTTVKLPSTLEIIGGWAFRDSAFVGNKDINVLEIPEGVTTINNGAFYNCTSIKKLSLPDTLETLGMGVFKGCVGLEGELKIPQGIKEIGYWTFYGCENITTLVLPKTIEKIGEKAFYGCSNLEGTISINEMTVSGDAFDGTKVTLVQ